MSASQMAHTIKPQHPPVYMKSVRRWISKRHYNLIRSVLSTICPSMNTLVQIILLLNDFIEQALSLIMESLPSNRTCPCLRTLCPRRKELIEWIILTNVAMIDSSVASSPLLLRRESKDKI